MELETDIIEINKILKEMETMNHNEKEYLKSNISKEQAERLLKKLCNNSITETIAGGIKLNESFSPVLKSKKPLWIDEVKKTCQELIPIIDIKDMESTKDMLVKEESEDMFISFEDYPYYQTIKKLQYAFGDFNRSSQRTVVYMHDFVKRLLVCLAKILNECEYKKIIEHLYSFEYNKFYNYKKLKFKSNIEEKNEAKDEEKNEEPMMSMEDEDIGGVLEEVADGVFELEENVIGDQITGENILNSKNITPNATNLNLDLSAYNVHELSVPNQNLKKNYLETIFEDKDEHYFENLAFQDQRTSSMTHSEYLEFISCRHQTFLSKGKKTFLNYLQTILQSHFPCELRDLNNLELLSFLLKETLKKIITQSVRNKHPACENKLFILNCPLVIDDVEVLCDSEIEKLESFLSDFHSDLYLIKEFKKKKSTKDMNKNVKVKRQGSELFLIIKKIIFIEDEDQIEFLKKNKKSSEEKVINNLKLFQLKYEEVVKFLKNLIEKLQIESGTSKEKIGSRVNTRNHLTKKTKIKKNKGDLINNSNLENNIDKVFVLSDVLANDLHIQNYYEYFLIKSFIVDNLEQKLSYAKDHSDHKSIIDEIFHKVKQLKKTNKKAIWGKFKIWLKLTNLERNFIIDEFNNITKSKNKFYLNEDESSHESS